MARPIKVGLDYFPLDVSIDDDVELLEAECGLEGFAILIKLWQKIYKSSYYIEWNVDNEMLFARKINSESTKVNSVINACLRRGLFNKEIYEKYSILTSSGIQKRYIKACSDSKRKNIPMIKECILVNSEFTSLITELTSINSELTLIESSFSTQSKVKKSKEEKSTSIMRKFNHLSITEDDNNKLVELGYTQGQVNAIYDSIENYSKNKNYSSLYLTARKWLEKEHGKIIHKQITPIEIQPTIYKEVTRS